MTKLDEAREALDGQWNRHIGGLFGRARDLTTAIEALLDAKLSPAPVGEDEPDWRWDDDAKTYVRCAPTPPAEGSDGGKTWAENEIGRDLANIREEFAVPELADFDAGHAYWLRKRLKWGDDRIADLEARLAEEKAVRAHREAELSDYLATAEADGDALQRALTDARKRIGDLEAGLLQADALINHWIDGDAVMATGDQDDCLWWTGHIERLHARSIPTAPASPETPEGQE